MIKPYYFILLIISTFFIGCKATKGIKDKSKSKKISTTQIITNHYAQKSTFKTLKASLKVNLKTADKEESVTADLRLLKDKKIWVSIRKMGITGAKFLITPTQVLYYNKLDENYFNGDFSLISNWLGTQLSFQQLQSVLLGESMFPIEPTQYESEILDYGYLLKPEQQEDLFEHYVTINPSNFKVRSQEIAQPNLYRILNIDYDSYQESSQLLLPLLINLSIIEKTSETKIDITYRNVSLNQELRYPFRLPSNYKEISIEK